MGPRYSLMQSARVGSMGTLKAQLGLLGLVDACICLSPAEVDSLRVDFGYDGPSWVVPNGVSDEFLALLPSGQTAQRKGIAVVGRIERRKNSVNLVRVLRETGIPTAFIGQINPNERAYGQEFLREVHASAQVSYRGPLSRAAVAEELSRTRLHVLASFAEVFPLVDLEALACGCAVVTTKYSLSTAHIAEMATVVDPFGLTPAPILSAYAKGSLAASPRLVRERFTWDAAAAILLAAYKGILHARAR